MQIDDLVFIGVYSHVVALDKRNGGEVWRCRLIGGVFRGDTFVTLLVEGDLIFAHTGGVLFCLEAATGRCLWENKLSGLGYGFASIAAGGMSASPELMAKREWLQRRRRSED